MERRGPDNSPKQPRRRLIDRLTGRNRDKKPPTDPRPEGYSVAGGETVPTSSHRLTSEQIYGVLNKITPELVANAMADLAATPVDPEDEVYAKGDFGPEKRKMLNHMIAIYPQAMRDLAATPVDPEDSSNT